MPDHLVALVVINIFCLALFAIAFLPARSIKWGWLWFAQILMTEALIPWLVISLILIAVHWSFAWMSAILLLLLSRRKMQLMATSNAGALSKTPLKPTDIFESIFPCKLNPSFEKLVLPGEEIRHLKLPCPSHKAVCIHIHGGAWQHGAATQLAEVARTFHSLQIETISINYVKYPNAMLPEIIERVEATFEKIMSLYPAGTRFIVYGRSAGGHLSLLLGRKFAARVSAIVALYPVTHFGWLKQKAAANDILKTPQMVKNLLGDIDVSDTQKSFSFNPIDNLSENFPLSLIVHGENDPVVDVFQSDLLFATMEKKKISAFYLRGNQITHGFDALWGGYSMIQFRRFLTPFLSKALLQRN